MNYHIRTIETSDKESFIQIFNQYVQEYLTIDQVYPNYFNPEIGNTMWQLLEKHSEEYLAVVAECESMLVGFCTGSIHIFDEIETMYFRGDKRGDAWDLATTPEWRGKGVGAALLDGLSVEFKKRGCEHMILNNVDINNAGAKRLYEKLGYTPWTLKYYKKI